MASLGEFDFIGQFLKSQAAQGQPFFDSPLALGIGDDAALIPPLPAGEQMVMATDMLVEGRHYRSDVDPVALGHKVLAVNLSDLAAMGARPVAFTLAAAMRSLESDWLNAFLKGLFTLARTAQCPLIGGDTVGLASNAPQSFTVTVIGAVPQGKALLRSGLHVGNDVWVSGSLGDAAYAVSRCVPDAKLDWPNPRLALGHRLQGLATAAIDISDGLSAELRHLLVESCARQSSTLGATIDWQMIPLGPSLREAVEAETITADRARVFAATGGDEYELLFAAPPSVREQIAAIGIDLSLALTRIGHVTHDPAMPCGIRWSDSQGQPIRAELAAECAQGGFDHFKS
jgi:thiamine-monophosphate kinase